MQTHLVILMSSIGILAIACGGTIGTDDPDLSTGSSTLASVQSALAVVPNLTPTPNFSDTTVPVSGTGAGDINPYGIAFVPVGFPQGGLLEPGDVIVSNFNNAANAQGTGTTIVRVNTDTDPSLFFTSKEIGLSTALGVLQRGYVVVGNLPSTGPTAGVCTQVGPIEEGTGPGALQIIAHNGTVVNTLRSRRFLNGPWDLTVKDEGDQALVFVSNALSGTVTRLGLRVPGGDEPVTVTSTTQIASGYRHSCNSGAFVVGPTGVALDTEHDILYVASTEDNAIFAIGNASGTGFDAGRGRLVVRDPRHLHGPVGLALAPNGDLVSAQGDAINISKNPNGQSEIVEFTPEGRFVDEISVEPTTSGAAFGVAVELTPGGGFRFAAVDDAANTLDLWIVK